MAQSLSDPTKYVQTPEQAAMLRSYKALMEEVKIRIGAINAAGNNQTGLPAPIVREFIFLQLRMLCELIALACLVAHGDIVSTTKLVKEWSAGTIVKELEELHKEFFPVAVRLEARPDPEPNHLERVTEGHLTKDDLIRLNGLCGDALHRGSLKKLLSTKTLPTVHLNDLREWANKIVNLLQSHAITTKDRKHLIACVLWNRQDNLNVSVQFAAALDGSEGNPITTQYEPVPNLSGE